MAIPEADPSIQVASRSRMRLERFPVTILFGLQLLAMIIIPAVVKNTEPLALIIGICTVAIATAFYTELLSQSVKIPTSIPKPVATKAGMTILIVGIVAVVASTLGGRGSYAVQLGLVQESAFVSIATPFTVWMLFGTAIMLWLYRRGQVSRKLALWVVATVALISLWEGLSRAILGQSAAFIVTVLVLAVLARLIRMRVIVVTLLLVPLLWPPIYDFRDSLRRLASADVVSANAPLERLQLDAQMALIGRLTPAPAGLEAPGLLDLIRIGLVPSFLDSPDRPAVDTSSRLSVALGGAATNSQSATMLGNLFIFEGWPGVVVFVLVLTILIGVAVRHDNPWALVFVGLIYWYGLSFNAGYPDVIPKMLQAVVSMVVAYAVVRLITGRGEPASMPPVSTALK